MATGAVVCSNCKKELSPSDLFCSQCGAKVVQGDVLSEPRRADSMACEVCGHENKHSGQYCEACGAKLPGSTAKTGSIRIEKKLGKKPHPQRNQTSSFKFETWHYLAGAVVVGIAGLFVYLEMQRDLSPTTLQSSQPAPLPGSSQLTTSPSKDLLDAIERLQKSVQDNPNDIGAQLLLANALHDGGMHDVNLLRRAIDAYKVYLKHRPGDPNARVDLGICYFELGKTDSLQSSTLFSMAIQEMETAVKGAPSHQPGAFNLGIVYLYSGNLDASNKWLRKAIELNAESDLGKRAKAILEQHSQTG